MSRRTWRVAPWRPEVVGSDGGQARPQAVRRRRVPQPRQPDKRPPDDALRGSFARLLLFATVPAALFLGHLTFGALSHAVAMAMNIVAAIVVGVLLFDSRVRQGLSGLPGLWFVGVLMLATMAAAIFTLTPWLPSASHPVWEWAGVSARAMTINRFQTLVEIIKLSGLATIFLAGALQAVRSDSAQITAMTVLILGGLYALASVVMLLTGNQVMDGGRLSGGFLSANAAGTVFGVLVVLGLAETLRQKRRHSGDASRILASVAPAAALTGLFLACLVATASRMGLVATGAAAAVLLVWNALAHWRGFPRAALLIGAAGLIACLVLLTGDDLLWRRLDGIGDDTVSRQVIYAVHWQAFLDAPLFGYGLGSFYDLNSMIMSPSTHEHMLVGAAHNLYLQWFEEAGVFGAAPMFTLVATVIFLVARRTGRVRRGPETIRGLVCANLVVLLHGLTDLSVQQYSIAAMWAFLLGLQFAWGAYRPRG